ncbi:hypothetical protein [Metabacillus fastidiosus]|nr:hypothetical protein [Metabacillus fastidiosus]
MLGSINEVLMEICLELLEGYKNACNTLVQYSINPKETDEIVQHLTAICEKVKVFEQQIESRNQVIAK